MENEIFVITLFDSFQIVLKYILNYFYLFGG